MERSDTLRSIGDHVRDEFDRERRIQSFSEWLSSFLEAPYSFSRSAPQYMADMLDWFGIREVDTPEGKTKRYRLFDQDFNEGIGCVHGQEEVHDRVQRLVRSFADAGRAERLILLHGPNGSGKSVIVEAIFRGLEHYSKQPEGALYRFNWVFPRTPDEGGSFGFRAPAGDDARDSYAHLSGDEMSTRLICEMKDHPLFLVPKAERGALLAAALEARPEDRARSLAHVLRGDVCQKCKGIYEGLLAGYQGDYARVLRHVQVERYYMSQRYREGAVTILPMGSVDANEQQITADLSAQNLPPILQNLKLFEPFGDLIDANGGALEFGDFLKRHMDLNKYLLNAVEKGTVTLGNSQVHLNMVMFGTSNEKHLDGFKQTPEWTSFKGRIELVPVPYLLEYGKEAELYEDIMQPVAMDVHVAPHTYHMAALFAVLTRLLPPDPDDFEGRLGELVRKLTPLEKADLYDHRRAPDRLERKDAQVLIGGVAQLRAQYKDLIIYEGRFGASAREMRMVLTQAAYDRESSCLTPALVLKRLADLIRDRTVYDFLKLEARDGYHAVDDFLEQISDKYARKVLDEIQDAMRLISEEEYDRQFERYLNHVIAFNRKENVANPQTGRREPPDEQLMASIERLFALKEPPASFRQNLVGRIGAYALDHPAEKVTFRALFPDLLRSAKKEFFRLRREEVLQLVEGILLTEEDEFEALPAERKQRVESTLAVMVAEKGYCAECARDAAAFLHSRYPE